MCVCVCQIVGSLSNKKKNQFLPFKLKQIKEFINFHCLRFCKKHIVVFDLK